MIEEKIIEWLDLGESVQTIDIYQKKKLLNFFKYFNLLVRHGIISEIADIIFQILFFLQIINLAIVNIDPKDDLLLQIIKYIENIIIPHKIITDSNSYIIVSAIIWSINLIHVILTVAAYILLRKKIIIKILYFFISVLNFIIYYYLVGPTIYLALSGTLCTDNMHEFLEVKCYSNSTHLSFTIINFAFGLYSLFVVETFALYYNQIGTIYGPVIKSRVNCDYDIYGSNAKLIVYIIVYFYRKYAKQSLIFKYLYQVYIFLSCSFLSIYTIKAVYYYNKIINTLIHFSWFFNVWFSLCIILKIVFSINDITLFVLFGLVLIIIVFIYQKSYSYYKRITQLDLFNEKSLVHIERFISELINLYHSTNKYDKLLLNGIIKKFEDSIASNPELNEMYNKLKNSENLKIKYFSLNELSMLSVIFTIYCHYLEKSEIKTNITLHMCYFLISNLGNPTFAIYLISKLKNNNHTQLYHKYVLMEKIKDYLNSKINKKSYKVTINNVQIGSVILYNQYMDLFKLKIYDATCNQIDYFDTLRNNITTGKTTENFLKTGENILILRKEIFKIWEKIIDLNPFSDESEIDYMLYLKTIMQDDILAKNEEKRFNLLKSSKLEEKNSIYYSMFKSDLNSVLLIDGYTTNGKIIYATPNFPFLYKFNGKEVINTSIEELIPNVVQFFHKDLIENTLKYSNLTYVFHKTTDVFLKGKYNSLFYVNLYIKPVPNLTYGLIFFVLLNKIQDHAFTIILDKDFKIDGFTEMNQGNSFTLNNNAKNNYYLSPQLINHHIGIILPEILLQISYKDNCYLLEKNNMDIKGNLYSINNPKDLDQKVNILLDIIKKKHYLNIEGDNDDGRNALFEYSELKKHISDRKNKTYSIFFKVETKKFLDGKYRYHRLYIINDTLIFNENLINDKTMNLSVSEYRDDDNKNPEKLATLGTIQNDNDEDNLPSLKRSNKNLNIFYTKYCGTKETNIEEKKKKIKLRIQMNEEIKNGNSFKDINKDINKLNYNEGKPNVVLENKINYLNTLDNKQIIESVEFNRFKNEILNKKDSVQITIMKILSFLFVILMICFVIYDYLYSNNLYSNLVEYLDENLYFTHSKIICSCIYISAVNVKWLKYKYIEEQSCPHNCTNFYLKIMEKCIKNLKSEKDILYTYDPDYQEIIMRRKALNFPVYNREKPDTLFVDMNDNLNIIISKGIKVIGYIKEYINFYGKDQINMEILIAQSLKYFQSNVKGIRGEDKLTKVNEKFSNNYLRIIICVSFLVICLIIYIYYIFNFNKIELFFLDKLINFTSPNFENYIKIIEDLKKKLKNTKMEEEENNLDEADYKVDSNNEGVESNNVSKEKEKIDKKKTSKVKENKSKSEPQETKKISKKRTQKQNKIQQQRIKKKRIMSFYFYKENILFATKISLILICFISFFVVSFIMYNIYLENFLKFDESVNGIEDLYYDSFRVFLNFKSELEVYQSNFSYIMTIPSSKEIQMPNFGNILNELTQSSIYSKKNLQLLKQLYNGNLCLLLFLNETTPDYINCKEFISSILLKGMEQAIIQIGVMINNVIDELSLISDKQDFNATVFENSTNFKKYEFFIEYYLLLSYLKNEEIFNNLRVDETKNVSNSTTRIIIIYLVGYVVLFFLLIYFIFVYKYIYNSLFNFIVILSVKFISDDENFYQKIIELEKKLYK